MNENHAEAYIDLLKRSLTHSLYRGSDALGFAFQGPLRRLVIKTLRRRRIELVRVLPDHEQQREVGGYWPLFAQTMIGTKRLDSLQECVETVIAEGVPGDLIEAGVWRGGATILMRGLLKARNVTDRLVWVADSFRGLPAPDAERYPIDEGSSLHEADELAVPLDEVRDNFRRYGLLDEQVRFLPGWFGETLATLGDERFAVVRLDGDLYSSTIDGLRHLYPRLSDGGFLIVDDYNIPNCRRAVEDYREEHRIREPIVDIDGRGVYWRRAGVTDPAAA